MTKTTMPTTQELLTEATIHVANAYKLINQAKMRLGLLNKIFHDDDDEPVYTPPKGCMNCPIKDFSDHT
jgi:hypothetical protein